MTAPRDYRYEAACQVENCHRDVFSAGLCTAHYQRKRRYGTTDRLTMIRGTECSIDGCVRKPHSKGYCINHYMRNHRHGDPNGKATLVAKGQTCQITGCGLKTRAKNLCAKHYANYSYARRHGNPQSADQFIKRRNASQAHSQRLGDEPHANEILSATCQHPQAL